MGGKSAALLTRHGKARVIAPVLDPFLASPMIVIDSYDTDQLGTFTGEIPRPGTQLETARMKARLAIERGAVPVGLGSEGQFGPHPSIPFLSEDRELLVWLDQEEGLELVGRARSTDVCHRRETLADTRSALQFAESVGFPAQGVVLRVDAAGWLHKECRDEASLLTTVQSAPEGALLIETDMRAHRNPSRMRLIEEAAKDLARRIQTTCPRCSSPGFGLEHQEPGLPCEVCREPSQFPAIDVHRCPRCHHQAGTRRPGTCPAMYCNRCNP